MEETGVPRRYAIISACVCVLFLAELVNVGVANRNVIEPNPLVIPWFGLSAGIGTALLYLNGRGIGLRGPVMNYLGYGASGALGGFAIQQVVNGGLLRSLGPAAGGIPGAMLLGLGSAICQTLGKMAAVSRFRRYFKDNSRLGMAVGLSVGLGFGLAELIILSLRVIPEAANITNLYGVEERSAAIGFHIYSGGLLALAFMTKEWWIIAMVVMLHSISDGMGLTLAHEHILAAELLFIVIAAINWYIWRTRSRKLAEASKAAPVEAIQNET